MGQDDGQVRSLVAKLRCTVAVALSTKLCIPRVNFGRCLGGAVGRRIKHNHYSRPLLQSTGPDHFIT